jgi:hypothetical protein
MSRANLLLVLAAVAGLGFAAYAAFTAWTGLAGVEMSPHGWAALALGSILSLAVAGGLMMLVFHSSRHGHDDVDQDGPR